MVSGFFSPFLLLDTLGSFHPIPLGADYHQPLIISSTIETKPGGHGSEGGFLCPRATTALTSICILLVRVALSLQPGGE